LPGCQPLVEERPYFGETRESSHPQRSDSPQISPDSAATLPDRLAERYNVADQFLRRKGEGFRF
jgi:hypothetical protein